MLIAPAMAQQSEPGAPIAPDEIDPELVKLARTRMKVGVITAAGLVYLSIALLVQLGPDRRFAGNSAEPTRVTVADIVAGKVEAEKLVAVDAEPLVSRAIRATKAEGSLGHRVVPVRGSGDRLWIAMSGYGWEPPATGGYVGRLRKLDDLAFAAATRAYAVEHPAPVFASPAAVRAGLASAAITTVAGDTVSPGDRDAIALDVVDPNAATIVASFSDRLPDAAAWRAALDKAGIRVASTGTPDAALGQVRFTAAATVTDATTRLAAAAAACAAAAPASTCGLLAARVEPVTRHHRTTWAVVRKSPPAGFDVGGTVLPDAEIELIGLSVSRGIPADAYALVTDELPDDYWYVMPITIALAVVLVVFAWALIRAIRRDLIPARQTA
jgi:hypothetical protein